MATQEVTELRKTEEEERSLKLQGLFEKQMESQSSNRRHLEDLSKRLDDLEAKDIAMSKELQEIWTILSIIVPRDLVHRKRIEKDYLAEHDAEPVSRKRRAPSSSSTQDPGTAKGDQDNDENVDVT